MTDSYKVTYEWDGEYWFAKATDVRGAHTQGRTLRSARERIREAIALMADREEDFETVDRVILAGTAQEALTEARFRHDQATEANSLAARTTAQAVAELTELGLSTRDIGELVGVSHTKAHQIASARLGQEALDAALKASKTELVRAKRKVAARSAPKAADRGVKGRA